VQQIMTLVPYGWLIRSIHAWSANLLIGIVALHFLTVAVHQGPTAGRAS